MSDKDIVDSVLAQTEEHQDHSDEEDADDHPEIPATPSIKEAYAALDVIQRFTLAMDAENVDILSVTQQLEEVLLSETARRTKTNINR